MRRGPASPFPSCPASCPPPISTAWRAWRPRRAPPFPPGWPRPMKGWTRMWKPAASSPPPCWPTRCSSCARRGFGQFHFYTLNQANLTYAACRILGIRAQGFVMSLHREARIAWMKQEAQKRLLLLDGSWGVMIQGFKLGEEDFRGQRFGNHPSRAEGQQRPSHPDQAGDHPGHRPPVSGSRRRFHRDQHLQLQLHQPGRLRPGPSGGRAERSRRPAGARLVRRIFHRRAPAPGRGRAGPGQPHRHHLARRQRSRLPQHHLRPAARNLSRRRARPDPRRRRCADDRDGVRHPELQGGDLRHRGSVRRDWACACRSGFPAPSPTCRAAP